MKPEIRFKDTPLYQKGHTGELLVSEELQKRGFYVIPSYDYSGEDDNKAPRMEGVNLSYVIPDLDTMKDGNRYWIEVKTKEEATFTRKTQKLEHGIPLRHYRHYHEVEKISGCAVFLAVYEIRTGDILMAKLSNLDKHVRIYDGGKMSRGGMAFFPRDAFDLLRTI